MSELVTTVTLQSAAPAGTQIQVFRTDYKDEAWPADYTSVVIAPETAPKDLRVNDVALEAGPVLVERVHPVDGDIILLRVPNQSSMAEVDKVKRIGQQMLPFIPRRCAVFVLADNLSVSQLDEDRMRKEGWVRPRHYEEETMSWSLSASGHFDEGGDAAENALVDALRQVMREHGATTASIYTQFHGQVNLLVDAKAD